MLWLHQGLPKDRYEGQIACLRNLAPFAERLRASGQNIVDVIGMRHQLDVFALIRLYRYLRRARPDILHIHSLRAAIWGRPIGRLARVPIILYSVHNKWGGWLHHILDRWSSSYGDAVIPFSLAVKKYLVNEVRLDPLRVTDPVYIGIDTDRFRTQGPLEVDQARKALGIGSADLVVGFVGALSEQKGLIYLFQALDTLRSEFPQLRCLIVGEGPQEQDLKRYVREQGLENIVLFLGQRYDVDLLLHVMDVFVLPSLWEGLPQVVLEAMAAGRPVVATAVDGTPEIIQDGSTGLLVPPADPYALSSAVKRLLRDRRLRKKLGERGQDHVVRNFDMKIMITNFEKVYRRFMEEKCGNARGKLESGKSISHNPHKKAVESINYFPLPNPRFPWFLLPVYDSSPIHYFVMHILSSRFSGRRLSIALLRFGMRLGLHRLWPFVAPPLAKAVWKQR